MSGGQKFFPWILVAVLGNIAGAASFAGWVRTYGESHNMHLDRRWQQPLTPGGRPLSIARLCEGEDEQGAKSEHVAYLLDDQQSRRWAITFEQQHRVYCDSDKPDFDGHLRRRGASAGDLLLFDAVMSHQQLQYSIGLRGGEPVVVGEWEWNVDRLSANGDYIEDDELEDWDDLVRRHRRGRLDEKPTFDRRAAIIPVLRETVDHPALTQHIRGPWDGDKDGNLRVTAEPAPDGRVHLHIDLTDDLQVLAAEDATDTELARADHLELWHCFSQERTRAFGCGKMHKLVLAFTRAGHWIVRGSAADPGLTPPTASGSATAADILLDVGAKKDGARVGFRRRFTVVYSDADGADAPALLGTSLLDPKDPSSLGLLVAQPGYRRYPAIGSSTKVEMILKAL